MRMALVVDISAIPGRVLDGPLPTGYICSEMATPLPVWARTDKWAPASAGGGSQGFSVECVATGELGHAKPLYIWQEVLASRLADEAGVTVPQTRLGNCEDKTIAVSKLFGSKSMDVPTLRVTSPQEFSSEAFKNAVRKGSGLLSFHAWVNTQDLKDEHVILRGHGPGEYEIACIDFAFAFSFDSTGGVVVVPQDPPVLRAEEHQDPDVIRQTIKRIEAVTDARIRTLVGDLAEDVLPAADRDRVVHGLVARRDQLGEAFKSLLANHSQEGT
jgi:hypothetical protein